MPRTEPVTTRSHGSAAGGSWLTTLGWGAYVACSWTWCIGMFLPVLLVRDFGIWGFVVFAVPNVIGAAGMGWVLRRPGASEALARNHCAACRWFSAVTVLFQGFFVLWLMAMTPAGRPFEPESHSLPRIIPFVLLLVGMIFSCFSIDPDGSLEQRRARASGRSHWRFRAMWAPILLWLTSMGFAWGVASAGEMRLPDVGGFHSPPASILALAPVCAFGFLLCPLLDLTLHHARQRARGHAGTAAFTIGFGFLFPAMILFTLGYAHLFLGRPSLGPTLDTASIAWRFVCAHIMVQLVFTLKVHLFQVLPDPVGIQTKAKFSVRSFMRLLAVSIPLALAIVLVFAAMTSLISYHGLSAGEIVYRLFMAFYGLVFPAYVWLCVIPTRHEPGMRAPTRAKLTILFAAVALAAPFYWMGFIERQTWWLAPGLGIILLARLFLPRREVASAEWEKASTDVPAFRP